MDSSSKESCKLCNPINRDEKVISIKFCEKCWSEFNQWLNVGNQKNINKPENCKFCGKYKFLHKSHNYSYICIECLGDKFCSKYQKGETDAIENKETSQTNGGSRT
jgi:hypothetical protein